MKLGIIGPCDNEINPLIESMYNITSEKNAMLDFHIGKYAGINIVALFCAAK